MARVALLDVNVLVALFDPDHVHHEPAHAWFAIDREAGWATCPMTENGLVRILSKTAYTGTHATSDAIRSRLGTFCGSGDHVFWPDELSIRDERFRLSRVTHRQLTDVYLLALAAARAGRLATFDRSIHVGAVVEADEDSLAVIPA
jgi:hypothetical protein